MMHDAESEECSSTVRLLEVDRQGCTSCGFNLTRGKWDPYPWVSGVDVGSAAQSAGMRPGDCLLEVNGEDVVGQRISEIAERVKFSAQVSLLLWNAGVHSECSQEVLCCGPMPQNLQRLSACMSAVLTVLECPVCLDTIPPPAQQCDNGHLICIRCRVKSDRCPVCRLRFSRARSLLADQVYNIITDSFDLREDTRASQKAKIKQIFNLQKPKNVPEIKITRTHTNKILARLIGKSTSVDNLSSSSKSIISTRNCSYLKSKSLSTNEISKSSDSMVLRCGKSTKYLELENFNRPASYHGSLESIHSSSKDERVPSVYHKFQEMRANDNVSYYCPYEDSCSSYLKGYDVIQHFRGFHNGPLVQYFTPTLSIPFLSLLREKDTCCVIHYNNDTFFLKICADSACNGTKNKYSGELLCNVHIWMWVLSEKHICKEYQLQVNIVDTLDNVLLSVPSSIYSLRFVTAQDIKNERRGIFLNSRTLEAISNLSSNTFWQIEVVKLNVEC